MCLFFSLFFMQNKLTSLLNPHHLFPQIHTNTNTPTHKHIDKSSQRVPRPGLVSRTSSSSLSCRVTRLSLTQWVRAPSIRRVLWILGPSLRRHKWGEVSYGLKKSTGIRFSLFFCFGGDVGFDRWCGFECLIGDVGFERKRKKKKEEEE